MSRDLFLREALDYVNYQSSDGRAHWAVTCSPEFKAWLMDNTNNILRVLDRTHDDARTRRRHCGLPADAMIAWEIYNYAP